MAYAFIDEQRVSILAYDVTIANMEERKKKAIEFKTLKLAEQKLGVGQHVLKNALKNRGRVFSTLYQKEFAVRLKPIKR
jgi:tRNA G18 (ribose-2'-O)-methylase SpoU